MKENSVIEENHWKKCMSNLKKKTFTDFNCLSSLVFKNRRKNIENDEGKPEKKIILFWLGVKKNSMYLSIMHGLEFGSWSKLSNSS